MKTLRISLFLLAALLPLAVPAHAVFDELAVSPRARAMGEAAAATGPDAWSYFHNPAALSLLPRLALSTSTFQPHGLDPSRISAVGGAYALTRWNAGVALGFRTHSLEYRDVTLLDEQVFSAAFGFQLYEDVSSSAHLGMTFNVYSLEFGETVDGVDPGSASAVGLDLGAIVTVRDRTRVGFFTRNLNSPTIGLDEDELPRMVVFGVAYEPYDGVVTSFDIRNELNQDTRFHGGAEMGITDFLALRAGIMTAPSKITAGFAITLPMPFTLEYAFSTGGGTLDETHQFGLSFRLSGSEQ